MTTNAMSLLCAALTMVLLVGVVGVRLLYTRVREMRQKRIHPQAAATSVKLSARLEDVQAADNFRNLFEIPVLFYALIAVALAMKHVPQWLVLGAWAFVVARVVHSYIHCTYNRVMHRLTVFLISLVLIVALWVAFVTTVPTTGA